MRALKGFDDEIQKRIDKSKRAKDGAKFAEELCSLRAKVQKATVSLNKEDLFDVIPDIAAVYQMENREDIPEDDENFTYIVRAKRTLETLNMAIIKSIAEYVRENNGALTNEMASRFVTVFLIKGFFFEYDWEVEPLPIGGADIFIANPGAVVARLKASPWPSVQKYIGGNDLSSTQYFGKYESQDDKTPELNAKYLANKAEILAKHEEVKRWVIQQEKQTKSNKR